MNLRLSLAVAACGLALASTGCTTPSAAFRGQSPENMIPASPTGWNPHHYGGMGDQFHEGVYDSMYGTESFYGSMGPWTPADGGVSYGGGRGPGWQGRLNPKREQRLMSRGILPPPGSPYANGYIPTPKVDTNSTPDHVVDGVKIYDAAAYGRHVSPCPPGTPWDQCRHGQYDLMPGGCPHCGSEYIRWMPTHYQTYAYHRPNDLNYPSQNSVGGAVVYSYYTLKGPSDFFHDEDGVY